jgi:prepilin-type N-terminal cleavage/methylation domain-containing protein
LKGDEMKAKENVKNEDIIKYDENEKGFTLIELLVVMAVATIIVGLVRAV